MKQAMVVKNKKKEEEEVLTLLTAANMKSRKKNRKQMNGDLTLGFAGPMVTLGHNELDFFWKNSSLVPLSLLDRDLSLSGLG